jgi:hypothetical protein
MSIHINNVTAQAIIGFNSPIYTGYGPITDTRPFRSETTVTELIYLMAQRPLFGSADVLNLGDPNHWIGICTKTVYRA